MFVLGCVFDVRSYFINNRVVANGTMCSCTTEKEKFFGIRSPSNKNNVNGSPKTPKDTTDSPGYGTLFKIVKESHESQEVPVIPVKIPALREKDQMH